MSPGRCAGCGFTSTSCKKVREHCHGCPEFAELYHADPDRALDPEAEHRRWSGADGFAAREARRDVAIAESTAARQAQQERFTFKDILE